MKTDSAAALMLTVDLELPRGPQRVAEEERLESTTGWLIDLLQTFELPATWAVADPVHSAATDRLLQMAAPIEIAIVADAAWLCPGDHSARLACELTRRVQGARSAGIPVTTLLVRDWLAARHHGVVANCGFNAIGYLGFVESQPHMSDSNPANFLTELPAPMGPLRGWAEMHLALMRLHQGSSEDATPASALHLHLSAASLIRLRWFGRRGLGLLCRQIASLREHGRASPMLASQWSAGTPEKLQVSQVRRAA